MSEFEKKKKTIKVCDEDIVVIFHLGKMLLPKRRRIIDKAMKKLPSTMVN